MENIEDIKKMIQAEVSSIQSLKERTVFKGLMENVFISLWETNDRMYKDLERRVLSELDCDINRYRVQAGLVEKECFDPSDELMAPVSADDIKTNRYTAGEMRKIINSQGSIRLATVFVTLGSDEIGNFLSYAGSFTGRIKADKEYPVKIFLKRSVRYLDSMEQLYHLFMKNGVPWQTLNVPYFFKMVDIFVREIPDDIPDEEEITDFGADFGAFNENVRFGMIPVWNIHKLELESMGFPIPCKDHESYEHTVSISGHGIDNAYLVEDRAGIEGVTQRGNFLYITGYTANEKRWDVYMIAQGERMSIDRYGYPIFKNQQNDSFAEKYNSKRGQTVKTKAELERFVKGFGLEGFVAYQGCALKDEPEERIDTYTVDFFVHDEIRTQGGRKKLALYFKPVGRERWLLLDLVSFITSNVQKLYPEYQCGGRLI